MQHLKRQKEVFVKIKGLFNLFAFLFVIYLVIYFQEYQKSKLLLDFKTTKGIIVSKSTGYRGSSSIHIEYKINDVLYKSNGVQIDDCSSKFEKGEWVTIKYSLKDPQIVSILDCE